MGFLRSSLNSGARLEDWEVRLWKSGMFYIGSELGHEEREFFGF